MLNQELQELGFKYPEDFVYTALTTGGGSYSFSVITYGEESVEKAGVVQIIARDNDGAQVLLNRDKRFSDRFQDFEYFSTAERQYDETRFTLDLPQSVRNVELQFHSWQSTARFLVATSIEVKPVAKKTHYCNLQDLNYEIKLEEPGLHRISIETSSNSDISKAGLVAFSLKDQIGRELSVPGNHSHSPSFGSFIYISGSTLSSQTLLEVECLVPNSTLLLLGHDWRDTDIKVLSEPLLMSQEGADLTFASSSGQFQKIKAEDFRQHVAIPENANEANLVFEVSGESEDVAIPLRVEISDENNQKLLPAEGLAYSQTFGSFAYLRNRTTDTSKHIAVTVPPDANYLFIAGQHRENHLGTITSIPSIVWNRTDPLETARSFIADVDAKKGIILIDTTAPPMGDESRALRPNNMTREYAKLGYKVIFFAFGSIQNQPLLPYENVLQIDREYFDDVIALLLELNTDKKRIYISSSFGSLASVCTTDLLAEKGWRCVYEIRDDMEEFNRVGYSKWYSPELERAIIQKTHKVITVSPALAQKADSLLPGADDKTSVIPNAVRPEIVSNTKELRSAVQWNERPFRVGYVGHLTPSWFDWRLLISIAESLPDLDFEIIGHGMPLNLSLPKNMKFLGSRTHEELPEIVGEWRVGIIIPFLPSPLTRGVDPNKLYEYLSWGLRTVSAPMGSVDTAPGSSVYHSEQEFVDKVRSSVETPMSSSEMHEIALYLEENQWSNRAMTMLTEILAGS